MSDGLYYKYKISKNDGSPVDPKADYIVLRLDTDHAARIAVRLYAMLIRATNYKFANDLLYKLDRY